MIKLRSTLIIIGGGLSFLFTIFHLAFWKLFNWDVELNNLSTVNSNIMQMLNIGSAVILFSLGFLLLFKRKEIMDSKLGKYILIIIAGFYFARLVMEFVFPEGELMFGAILMICVLIYLLPAVLKS